MTREDINDIINAICPNDEDYEKPCISPKYLRQELEQLVLDQKQWNQEPTTKNDLEVDCIDRKEFIDWINIWDITPIIKRPLIRHVQGMPSVTPIRLKGHWMGDSAGYKCNICGHDLLEIAHSIDYIDFKKPNFCPNCSVKMESEVEE